MPRPEVQLRQPMFDRQMHGLTPAERGTAHHLFMQFCDFAVCAQPGGVQAELNRMRDKRILAPEQADAIEVERIEKFFASRLFREDFAAAKVRREFKFSGRRTCRGLLSGCGVRGGGNGAAARRHRLPA